MYLPETIPHEITTNFLERDNLTPEHHLLIAILVRSILDYLDDTAVPYHENPNGGNCVKARAKWEADQFFFPPPIDLHYLDPENPPPFSLHWIASFLSEDPATFIDKLRRLLLSAPKRSAVVAQYGRYAPGRILASPSPNVPPSNHGDH